MNVLIAAYNSGGDIPSNKDLILFIILIALFVTSVTIAITLACYVTQLKNVIQQAFISVKLETEYGFKKVLKKIPQTTSKKDYFKPDKI